MRWYLIAVVVSLAFVVPAGAAFAKSGMADNKAGGPEGVGSEVEIGIDASISFGADEARIIRDYFAEAPYDAKPLPPGIAKNLARGKPLPPGIAKRYLPRDLAARLPVRADYERLIAGDDILLVSIATGIIVDILSDAF
ncbi:MAG: anti-virulence regulator CigR family protein [Parvibaculum sp.]|uniref:anti-virulence regulator CigR family protein n=1 Tax=Parvibaculum sp. TaxID=2024848 RepID=UPI0034A05156